MFISFFNIVIHYQDQNVSISDGQPTKFGVSKQVFENFTGSAIDVSRIESMSLDDAARIYKKMSYDKVSVEYLPPGINLMVFDWAVEAGVPVAVKELQVLVGERADGVMGPDTVDDDWREYRRRGGRKLIEAYYSRRIRRYESFKQGDVVSRRKWMRKHVGWERRAREIKNRAIGMV